LSSCSYDHGNIIERLKFKIQLVEIIVFTEAKVTKTTEAAASVASNVATVMTISRSRDIGRNRRFNLPHLYLAPPLEFRRDLWQQKIRKSVLSCGIKMSPVGSLD